MQRVRYEGEFFWPASAAVSVLGSSSAGISSICLAAASPGDLPPWSLLAAMGSAGILYVSSLALSTIGLLLLPVVGTIGVGELMIGHRRVAGTPLWLCYLAAYLLPWALLGAWGLVFSA